MARQEKIVIQTRLGEQTVDTSKLIYFPRGIIGFEDKHEFTLLQVRPDAPMLILQSIDDPTLGLLVADPYFFFADYSLKIGDAEQKLLCLDDAKDATILVTVSIPHGKPHLTSLNLTGPIIINSEKKFGLQVPQSDANPPHVLLESLMTSEGRAQNLSAKNQQEENVEENDKVEENDIIKESTSDNFTADSTEADKPKTEATEAVNNTDNKL